MHTQIEYPAGLLRLACTVIYIHTGICAHAVPAQLSIECQNNNNNCYANVRVSLPSLIVNILGNALSWSRASVHTAAKSRRAMGDKYRSISRRRCRCIIACTCVSCIDTGCAIYLSLCRYCSQRCCRHCVQLAYLRIT